MNSVLKSMSKSLDSFFAIEKHHSTVKTEMMAGMTTFFTMAYIIFVNPAILSHSGMNFNMAFTATCLTAALGSLLIGLWSNYPIAIAPSMGLNAYFSYVVVDKLGFSWETALGAVFIAGVLFLLLTLSSIREKLVRSIPRSLAIAIAAGIGLLLGLIALQNIGIVNVETQPFFQWQNLHAVPIFLALFGLLLVIFLRYKKIPGAILISIFSITFLSLLIGHSQFQGVLSIPVHIKPAFKPGDVFSVFNQAGFAVIFAFFLVSLFDSTGTLVGLLEQMHLKDNPKRSRKLSKALLADSVATISGAVIGTSTVSPYIESAAGIAAGGKTGLVPIVVSLLFLLALFFSPLAKTIPDVATAPALLFIAYLMGKHLKTLDFHDFSEIIPALITVFAIPIMFSIADGVGIGIISYVTIKMFSKKRDQINWMLFVIAAVFVVYFMTKP